MTSEFKKLKPLIQKARRIVIACHIDPDADTLGSALAMAGITRQITKAPVVLYCPTPVPPTILFLPGAHKVTTKLTGEFDLGMTFDCGTASRISPDGELLRRTKCLVNIDHHLNNERYGTINIIQVAAATGEMVYKIARVLDAKINKDMATNLYAAIATDTGNFRYDATTPVTFEIAAGLSRAGAKTAGIAQMIYERKSRGALAILGAALTVLKIGAKGRMAWVALPQSVMKKHKAAPHDLEGIVDVIRSLDGVEVAVLMRETPEGKVRINLRSKQPNIRPLAEKWGGGGHAKASGASQPGPFNRAVPRIIREVEAYLAKR